MKRWLLAWGMALLLVGTGLADPQAPPGFNVHLVVQRHDSRFWRGGAPRSQTLWALRQSARARHETVTLVDLRHPETDDDRTGKAGRLSPTDEAVLCRELGIQYISISALDPTLISQLDTALQHGDVYMHCMYGVNRTGFATARFATAESEHPDRSGLGTRDWQEGEDFQHQHH